MPNAGITIDRKENSIFSQTTDTFRIVAFKRASDTLTSFEEIVNKKVAVVKQNIGLKLMKNHPKELLYIKQSNKEALFSLLSGEVDVLVYPELPINKILKKLNLADKVVAFSKPLKEIKRAIRVQKENPELLKKLDDGLSKLKQSGEFQKIYTKWFGVHDIIEIKQTDFNKIVTSGVVTFILVIALIIFLIRTIQLKKSVIILKDRFQDMFEKHDSIMLIIEPNTGKILDANKSALNFYGYTKAEILELKITNINTLNYKEVKKRVDEAYSNINNRFEFLHKLKDGTKKVVAVHSTPIKIDKGKVLFSIIEDITEKKEFEKQLLKAQEIGGFGSYRFDINSNQWYSSSELDKIFGIDETFDKTVESWIKLIHPDFIEEMVEYLQVNILQNKEEFDKIYKIINQKTNEEVWVHGKGELRLDKHGNPKELFGMIRNITNEKILKDSLLNQKIEFETIFKYSQDGIAILDLESKFLNFNDAYLTMTGFSKEELLSKSCVELSAPEDIKRAKEALNYVLEHGFINNFEKTCIVKDAKRIKVTLSVSLLPDKKRFLMVTKDTTSLKLMEEQSRLASMGEMIGNIAHQWRQPLSIISTNASGTKLQYELNNITKESLDISMDSIVKQTNYLSETIDNFRDFIKGEKFYGKTSLSKVINSAVQLTEASLKNNYINLIKLVDDDIYVLGSENELVEAFINIINNSKDALKSNIKEENERFISIIVNQKDENLVEIKIMDSAGGIDVNILNKIFEPYFSTKHKSQGTGLGLSMVDKIIRERHQGQIDVYNETFKYEGKLYTGACFNISLNSFVNK